MKAGALEFGISIYNVTVEAIFFLKFVLRFRHAAAQQRPFSADFLKTNHNCPPPANKLANSATPDNEILFQF